MELAPDPCMHASHGRTHDEPRVIHTKAARKQAMLRFHHVDVPVAREFRMQAVARLARFAVTDPVRQDNEKLGNIERLIFPEKLAGKFRADKLRATAGRS